MARLEEITVDAELRGVLPNQTVKIISARFTGPVLTIVYKDAKGFTREEILFRDREPQ